MPRFKVEFSSGKGGLGIQKQGAESLREGKARYAHR